MIDALAHLEMNQPAVLILNALLCIVIMGISLCRLNAMDKAVLNRVKFEYAFFMGAGFISMARPWWGENVGWASLMLETAILVGFVSSSHAWRPIHTREGIVDTPPDNARGDEPAMEVNP